MSPVVIKSVCPIYDVRLTTKIPTSLLFKDDEYLILVVWYKSRSDDYTGRDVTADHVLGFVRISLTPLLTGLPSIRGWHNIVNFSNKVCGQLKVSVEPLEKIEIEESIVMKVIPDTTGTLSASCSLWDLKSTVDKLDEKISKMNEVIMECVVEKNRPDFSNRVRTRDYGLEDEHESSVQTKNKAAAASFEKQPYNMSSGVRARVSQFENERSNSKSEPPVCGLQRDYQQEAPHCSLENGGVSRESPMKSREKLCKSGAASNPKSDLDSRRINRGEEKENSSGFKKPMDRKSDKSSHGNGSKANGPQMSKEYFELKSALEKLEIGRKSSDDDNDDVDTKDTSSPEPLPSGSLSSSASSSWSSVLKSNQDNAETKPKNKTDEDTNGKRLKFFDEIQNFDLERINKIFRNRQK
uniref:C2 domain-containing protein 3 n=2 Tax=Cacopsylla melanoneura TaxID=428564 RepID=A0A8D8X475_9HEMI